MEGAVAAVVDGTPPMGGEMPRRVTLLEMIWLGVFWFAMSFLWGALLTIVVPSEVLRFVPEARKGFYLGLVLAVGAVTAMVVSPIAGALSDRSTLSMGRRRPFVIAGALLGCLGLLGMRHASTYVAFAGSLLLVQAAVNFAGGAFNGLIPDKIPRTQRGLASGVLGIMMMAGTVTGMLLAGGLVGHGAAAAAYGVAAAVLLVSTTLMVWNVREDPLRAVPPMTLRAFIRSFWIDPRRHPDFAWMFVTRGLVMLGFYTMITFLQFFIKDTLNLSPQQAAQATGRLGAVVVAAGALVSLGAGWTSDHVGRRAIVSASGMFLGLTGLGLLFQPPFTVLLGIGILFGIGYGAFTSVDWALAVDVLPSGHSAAKDLGIWAIANTLPQVLAPATAGPLLDAFNLQSANRGYTVIFSIAVVYVVLGSLLVWKIKGVR